MSSDEHNPEAYRQLFAIVGGGLQATSLFFILASLMVAPWGMVAVLGAVWIASTIWSWMAFQDKLWAPFVAGTFVAVCWIVALTVFA